MGSILDKPIRNQFACIALYSVDANKLLDILSNQLTIAFQRASIITENTRVYFNLGYFDILALVLFNRREDILKIQDIPLINNIIDYKIYSGTIININDFNFGLIYKYPLVVTSFFKLKKDFFKYTKANSINGIYQQFISIIKGLKNTHKIDFFELLITPYGWEDLIIIFFCYSYEEISYLINEIRNIKYIDFNESYFNIPGRIDKYPNHIFSSSYSICSLDIQNKATLNNIKNDNSCVGPISFQVEPGHMGYAINKINEIGTLDCFSLLGRKDILAIQKEKNHNFRYFLEKQIDNLLRLFTENEGYRSPFLSFEIQIQNTIMKDLNKNIEDNYPVEDIPNRDLLICIDEAMIKAIDRINEENIYPEHSIVIVKRLMTQIGYLSRNNLVSDTMLSFIRAVEHFFLSFINIAKIANYKKSALLIELDTILNCISLCYADRFRGIYPIGETSSMPLITYEGSYQKYLMVLDYISTICYRIGQSIIKSIFPFYQIEDRCICNYIGNNTTPGTINISNYKRIGIISTNLESIFRVQCLFYIFHEVGHNIFSSITVDIRRILFSKLEQASKQNSEVDLNRLYDQIEEIVSDYYCFSTGFRSNIHAFIRIFKNYYFQLFKEKPRYGIESRSLIVLFIFRALSLNHKEAIREHALLTEKLDELYNSEKREASYELKLAHETNKCILKGVLNSIIDQDLLFTFFFRLGSFFTNVKLEDEYILIQKFQELVINNENDIGFTSLFSEIYCESIKYYSKKIVFDI